MNSTPTTNTDLRSWEWSRTWRDKENQEKQEKAKQKEEGRGRWTLWKGWERIWVNAFSLLRELRESQLEAGNLKINTKRKQKLDQKALRAPQEMVINN